MNNTVISIGAFQKHVILNYVNTDYRLIVYEPNKTFFKEYDNLKEFSNIEFHQKAVASKAGRQMFYEHEGCSTLYKPIPPAFLCEDEYEVEVVSMTDILEEQDKVWSMQINCEGAEFDIIMNTDIQLLLKCYLISIEFHAFCEYFKFTEKDVKKCADKLQLHYHVRHREGSPVYAFTRRE